MLGSGRWRTLLLRIPVPHPLGQGERMFNALVWSFAFDLRDMSNEVCLCSRLVVSFCILLSDWFFFLVSDWLLGRKWRLLIGQISRLLIV